nr:hypothetical protein [Tanacetum cinerariifolium]
ERRIDAIDADEDITLVSIQDDADKEMFDVDVLGGEEIFVAGQNENVVEEVVDAAQVSTAATTVTITTEEITLAQALEALKTSKPKGKEIMIEEHVKPKKKDQIRLDEEDAKNLQAKFDEEERLTREKAKKKERANIALINHGMIFKQRLMLIISWLQDYKHKNKKSCSRREKEETTNKRSIEKDNVYLPKDMERYKLKYLKLKEFDSIQEMFDKAFKRVNKFENLRTKLVKGKEKRARTELEQEITKKQKVEDDKEKGELKPLMETIPDEE